jgi:hypothetical protein
MPCPDCGASVDRSAGNVHTCDPHQRLWFQMFGLRHEIAAFELKLREHLDTPTGRFESWTAAQQVRAGRG